MTNIPTHDAVWNALDAARKTLRAIADSHEAGAALDEILSSRAKVRELARWTWEEATGALGEIERAYESRPAAQAAPEPAPRGRIRQIEAVPDWYAVFQAPDAAEAQPVLSPVMFLALVEHADGSTSVEMWAPNPFTRRLQRCVEDSLLLSDGETHVDPGTIRALLGPAGTQGKG